jgi:hypothetical protein
MTGVNPATGFTQVVPTAEEVADWRRRYPRQKYPPYRSECQRCGRRIWHTGIAVGAHRRACKGGQGRTQ